MTTKQQAFDLGALWDAHCQHEFGGRDVDATMKTMVAEPYVNHIPTMTGGVGHDQLKRFYTHHFVNSNPEDTKLIPISRTIGADRVVDEMLFCFTHSREIDWMLPGVPPTGKYVEVPLIAIVCFDGGKLYNEHIYWDQASVLVQIGKLDPATLPVAGIETARKLVDKTLPSNTLMTAWANSEGKPVEMTPARPKIAYRKGFYHEVKAGQRYLWCSCGRSATQPFCDGSHVGTEFKPVLFDAKTDEDVIFCGCKHTGTGPFCDGAHNNLPGGYAEDDPDSPANRAVTTVLHGANARVPLDGACYVFSTRRARLRRHGVMGWCPVISPASGALFQSQFYAEIGSGASPVIGANDRHTVLFVTDGQGSVEIGGRRFEFTPRTGIYIRPGEAFRVHNANSEPVKLFISNGPGLKELNFLEEMPANFDETYPRRCAEIDPSQRHAMHARYFQILVNREHGSTEMTQFIGNIPFSKAEPHKHLYEEALIFLNGAGVVWTEHTKTTVGAGDVLFLPRKLTHSVQCTVEGGFDVVGVIYPGDNPSISY